MCRERLVEGRALPPRLRELLPNLRIITDPAKLSRLNAEAAELRKSKMPRIRIGPPPD
jgi:hypothetical protein